MLWWNWQRLNPRSEQYGGRRDGKRVQTSDTLKPFGVDVTSVLRTNTTEHCYSYPKYELFDPAMDDLRVPHLRSIPVSDPDPDSTPDPKPLPRLFLAMSNMNISRVRMIEQEFRGLNA